MLRLPDLPPGYVVGDDTGCGLMLVGEEGRWQALTDLTARHPHEGCISDLERRWTPLGDPAGPGLVDSAAIVFTRADGAHAALGLAPDAISFLADVRPGALTHVDAPTTIGDESTVYRTGDALVAGRAGRPGAAVLWRSGSVLALVFVAGQAPDAAVQEALRLAAAQQRRIASPTPLQPHDYDDSEVALDDPRLGVGVAWLGHRFAPGHGLRPIALQHSLGRLGWGDGPGWRAELDYGRSPASGTDVMLGLWRPRAWARFSKTRLGRLVWDERCTRVERLAVPGGSAVIYGGFERAPSRCGGSRAPDRYLAHVFFRHLVVSVNAPIGLCCREWPGRYDSLAGMRRVVRALRPR